MNKNLQTRELVAGTTLYNGKYTIEKVIGTGGFGITYKAVQRGLERTVAIKEYFLSGYCVRHTHTKTVILQGIKEDVYEKYRQKFVDEAKILATLKHTNIVSIIDVFPENNTSYIVMPFIEGETLSHLVEKQGALDYALMVNYLSQIADAVGYIHSKSILHRDIKPENIIITPDYHAILIDFGSAREFEQDKNYTHTAMLTQGYAPLEQYDKKAKRGSYTDIYALGAVYYFALTGQRPMDATTRTNEQMPEPNTINPAISKSVNNTIMKAMAMKPKDRYQTIAEFLDDLYIEQPSKTNKKISNKLIWWVLAAFLVIIGIIVVPFKNSNNKKEEQIVLQNKIIAATKVVNDSIGSDNIFFDINNKLYYHLFKDCDSLGLRVEMNSVEQAFHNGITQLCETCVKRVAEYKQYDTEARASYKSAEDLNMQGLCTVAEKYYNYALNYCNKQLNMRPDNAKTLELKKEIEERKK